MKKLYTKLTDTEKKTIIVEAYVKDKKSFQTIAEEYKTYSNKIRRDRLSIMFVFRFLPILLQHSIGTHTVPTGLGRQGTALP